MSTATQRDARDAAPSGRSGGAGRDGTVRRRSTVGVVVLCWLAVLLDGFDLVVLGTTVPSMLDDTDWSLSGSQATMITTIGLVGMTIGALTIGALTDRLGRRRVLTLSVLGFSVFTLGLGVPIGVAGFAVLRFLGGVALGGALPTAISLVTEFRPHGKAGSASTTVMTGYHVGAVLTALLAMFLIDAAGWHAMFIAGAVPGIVLAAVLWYFLPESPHYLRLVGRTDEADRIAESYGLSTGDAIDATLGEEATGHNAVATLLSPAFRRNSLAIWGTSFMGLLLVYGLNTWLPQIMREADYDLGSSLSFLLVANVGAVVGLVLAGAVSDRWSPRKTSVLWFVASAVFLALLAVRMPLVAIYVALFLTGVFVFSSQVLVYAFTGENHPASVRATAMGFSAGIGRLGAITGPILGGTLSSAGVAYPWGFFAFAAVGLAGAVIFSFSRTLNER
ncbi:aromatic acid/H+ symport family MFS transporter [Corynebacterium sp.]|jgi:AAHS family benzoate transporter-like MFS transporter|uniref:MFS transporter n=1 Tax=Corynebacterium sp. TaxID=1720 RepID=UPI0025C38C02|nr:aromatic acid/H+ symport family MFS transporter [Corynebacterium sp.]